MRFQFEVCGLLAIILRFCFWTGMVTANTKGFDKFANQSSLFVYQDINQCKRNEYYDVDYFSCLSCNDEYLEPSEDKFSCKCKATTRTIAIYDTIKEGPLCTILLPTPRSTCHGNGNRNSKEINKNNNTSTATSVESANDDNDDDNCMPATNRNGDNSSSSSSSSSSSVNSNREDNNDVTIKNDCTTKYVNLTQEHEVTTEQRHEESKSERLQWMSKKIFAGKSTNGNSKNFNDLLHLQKLSRVRVTYSNPWNESDCRECDLKYNFHYQGYCIVDQLLKPYLHYNSFWQQSAFDGYRHFGDLKFIAFFCLRMRNATACNHLANLCVASSYSFEKNSPCSAFLVTQSTDDAVFKYASGVDEKLQATRPFLFFKKGKQTAKLLDQPLLQMKTSKSSKQTKYNDEHYKLHFLSMIYALEGTLQRRGDFKLQDVNLCSQHSFMAPKTQSEIYFAQRMQSTLLPSRLSQFACSLSLRNLIDLASLEENRRYTSVFFNFSAYDDEHHFKRYMKTVPILIESLTPENQRLQPSEWLLVKRFQLISGHSRMYQYGQQLKPIYEDAYKLQLYRSIRFVERFELHYKIHDDNYISVPIIKLRYRTIDINLNSSLDDDLYSFKLLVTFARVAEGDTKQRKQLLNETLLPVLLLVAVGLAVLRLYNYRKRQLTSIRDTMDLCDSSALMEFSQHLFSNIAHALFVCFLMHVLIDSLKYLTQQKIEVTLPLMEGNESSLEILIYLALCFKLSFHCLHFWQCCHFDLFFIDWERPKSYDNNHFNLKSNLETSSLCSSVRTYVTENNVSAWRIFFTANEWMRLSTTRKTSILVQSLGILIAFKLFDLDEASEGDKTLKLFYLLLAYVIIYVIQYTCRCLLLENIVGSPLQKFIDLCSWANISIFILLESSYGFYVHGRSPHGFADTDMSSMVMQLQRESQNMCGRRGLLSDSDQQTYIILPPTNLRTYFHRLLVPFQHSCSISQAHYQKESSVSNNSETQLEKTSIAYSTVNRFFCAFIDHAIKDMDYIIKEKTVLEKIFNCEFENYLTENKGTFYIDNSHSFSQLFLYGNEFNLFIMEFLMLISFYLMSSANLIISICLVSLFSQLFQWLFHLWMRSNVTKKTLIDKRFLM